MLRYQDIFVPGGFPRYTYNPRIELQLEHRLAEVRENLCKLVTVTGQTKSGKTVLARKILPQEDAVWVEGGTVSAENDFWHVVIEQLGLFQSVEKESSREHNLSVGGKATGQASVIVAKGEVGAEANVSTSKRASGGSTRSVSSRVAALRGLRDARQPLVVDDFHYIPREMQGSIVRALKPLVFEGVPVVIIAIPHRRYDAMKVEKEMTGRISPIQIPVWSEDELGFIPRTGFGLLNYEVPHEVSLSLAKEAIGSPHLMQDFCRGICRTFKIEKAGELTNLDIGTDQLGSIFGEVAESIGRPIFEKLARGPRQRVDRLQRELKGGRTVDIYELVLQALAFIRPGLVSIEYEELRAAIRSVSASQPPQLQEVARVLKQMATIAATDPSSTPVIDFEEEEKKLHITDPYFAFYLRWGELAKQIPENEVG